MEYVGNMYMLKLSLNINSHKEGNNMKMAEERKRDIFFSEYIQQGKFSDGALR